MNENRFYVYVYFDPSRDMEPFYVGKGCGTRAQSHFKRKDSTPMPNRLRSMKRNGITPIIEKHDGLTENEAFDIEKGLIKQLGRMDLGTGPLLNLSDGGEGHSNPSAETRFKQGAYNRGRSDQITDEIRKKISEALKGVPKTETQKLKMSEAKLGKTFSEEHKQNMSKAWDKRKTSENPNFGGRPKGSKLSEETKKKMSEAQKGRKSSPEATAKRLVTMKEKYGDQKRTFNSSRHAGIKGEWSDKQFLEEIKDRIYIGVGGSELESAIESRLNSIIELLEKHEQ